VRRRVSAARPARPASPAKMSRRGRQVEPHEWNRCTPAAPAAPSRADPRRSTDHGANRPPTLGDGAALARTRGALAQDPATRVAGWLPGTRPPQRPRATLRRLCRAIGHRAWPAQARSGSSSMWHRRCRTIVSPSLVGITTVVCGSTGWPQVSQTGSLRVLIAASIGTAVALQSRASDHRLRPPCSWTATGGRLPQWRARRVEQCSERRHPLKGVPRSERFFSLRR
jgi:hypothetical protein